MVHAVWRYIVIGTQREKEVFHEEYHEAGSGNGAADSGLLSAADYCIE